MIEKPSEEELSCNANTVMAQSVSVPFTENSNNNNNKKEIKMADVDTTMLASQHSDIRREAAEHTNEIVKEGLKGDYNTQGAIKDARFDVNSRVASLGSTLDDRFFTVARDTADLRAQLVQAIDTVKMATEMNALKGIIEGQKNTTYLSDKITEDGEKTRGLINELKYHDLNRTLVERNTELVEERESRRHWRHHADQYQNQSQWAALQSQLQAFQSQLQETRQGIVNFGTMERFGQTSTSNSVR